jgi:hypothetical protein
MKINEPPPIILKFDHAVGLFCRIPEADFQAEDVRDCLIEDLASFTFNPPEAAHLAAAGKAVFVFGKAHPRVVADSLKLVGEEVVLDESIVMPETLYQPPVKQLLLLGEPRHGEKRDYAALGISAGDVPALINLATDEALNGGPPDSPVVYAPVHAWRALAQLRAGEAIAPLLALFQRADDDIDDWINGDLPESLAQFGAAVLDPLTAHLADPANGERSRVAAAETIGLVGKIHPELRMDSIARLVAQLERFAEQSETLNAFLISPLWELRAVEAMPVIERAFASGRVDESINGDVEDVQMEFGLKTEREHPRKPNKLSIWGDQLRAQRKAEEIPLPDADGIFSERDYEDPALSTPFIAPPKVGRNDPCPCGSGKKFKKCCGG